MKRTHRALLSAVVALAGCESAAPPPPAAETDSAATAPVAAQAEALNPVQQEMRLLDEAIRTSITAIANNTPQVAVERIHVVHAARTQTEAFLHSGQYAPLASRDTLEAFAAADNAFHVQLEGYAEALTAGDLQRAAGALGPMLQSCVACHERFRPGVTRP